MQGCYHAAYPSKLLAHRHTHTCEAQQESAGHHPPAVRQAAAGLHPPGLTPTLTPHTHTAATTTANSSSSRRWHCTCRCCWLKVAPAIHLILQRDGSSSRSIGTSSSIAALTPCHCMHLSSPMHAHQHIKHTKTHIHAPAPSPSPSIHTHLVPRHPLIITPPPRPTPTHPPCACPPLSPPTQQH